MKPSTLKLLGQKNLRVGLCSSGIAAIKTLDSILGLEGAVYLNAKGDADVDLYLGWGNKASGQKAMRLAQQSGKPFLLLEDAFVRSLAPQSVNGEQPLGLVLDDEGIYYDARRPSRLEGLIKFASADTDADKRGSEIRSVLSELQICKYNNFDEISSSLLDQLSSGGVLVVDQTWQDQSIAGALADETDFSQMLEAAIKDNPGKTIFVKLHPEVMAGKKRGYLKDFASRLGCQLLVKNINPWALFTHLSKVYVVSSQLGFDALMAGCEVHCYGLPFYAGWGLTRDQKPCARRAGFTLTVNALAKAAYQDYARYVDLYDAEPSPVEIVARQISYVRNIRTENKKLAVFYQVTMWKRRHIKAMFRPDARERLFFGNPAKAIKAAQDRQGDVVAWSSRIDERFEADCARAGVGLIRLEDGFIRSVGLGTTFHLPMSLVLDDLGIYYNPESPSRLEHILQNYSFDDALIMRAISLIEAMVSKDISKYNLQKPADEMDFPTDKQIILVPGQVDDDASIKFGGGNMTGLDLLRAVRSRRPDAFIIFKPHPDVTSGLRFGLSDRETALEFADNYAGDTPIGVLVKACQEVHTISSLTGFEALLRRKRVTCYGLPFYANWGLTEDLRQCDRRQRKLSLEQLVAGTLILYPQYFDPHSQLPCGPETIIKRIDQERLSPTSPSVLIQLRSLYGAMRKRFRG